MELITNREQLEANIKIFDDYVHKGTEKHKEWAGERILHGICFVPYKRNGAAETRFAPCRFLGYVDNFIARHDSNPSKDGRIVEPIIDGILGNKADADKNQLNVFLDYCATLGLERRELGNGGNERKFWNTINIE